MCPDCLAPVGVSVTHLPLAIFLHMSEFYLGFRAVEEGNSQNLRQCLLGQHYEGIGLGHIKSELIWQFCFGRDRLWWVRPSQFMVSLPCCVAEVGSSPTESRCCVGHVCPCSSCHHGPDGSHIGGWGGHLGHGSYLTLLSWLSFYTPDETFLGV